MVQSRSACYSGDTGYRSPPCGCCVTVPFGFTVTLNFFPCLHPICSESGSSFFFALTSVLGRCWRRRGLSFMLPLLLAGLSFNGPFFPRWIVHSLRCRQQPRPAQEQQCSEAISHSTPAVPSSFVLAEGSSIAEVARQQPSTTQSCTHSSLICGAPCRL